MRHPEKISKSPQWHKPGFGDAIDWNSDDVAILVYIIHDEYYDIHVGTDKILLLLTEWDTEDCMDVPLILHMR